MKGCMVLERGDRLGKARLLGQPTIVPWGCYGPIGRQSCGGHRRDLVGAFHGVIVKFFKHAQNIGGVRNWNSEDEQRNWL